MSVDNNKQVLRVFYEGDVSSEARIKNDREFQADVAWVVKSTNLPENQVRDAIAVLENAGYISPISKRSDRYHINHDKLDDAERYFSE